VSAGPQAERKTIVCVLGAPRCGTSLTARLLSVCGLYLGESEELVPPGPGNPAGFWELRRVARITERILAAKGGNNFSAPHLPDGWQRRLDLQAEREEARDLMAELFADREVWGWKDARTSLTLPFWQDLLPPMRYVICMRNPLDMAASIRRFAAQRQYDLSLERGLDLWQSYISSAILNTRGQPRLFVAYEEYFDDRLATTARLAHFAGLDPAGKQETAIGEVIDVSLRHHVGAPGQGEWRGEIPAETASLYSAIVEEADDEELELIASPSQGLWTSPASTPILPTSCRPRSADSHA